MMFFANSEKITFVEKFAIVILAFLLMVGFFSAVFSKNFNLPGVGGGKMIDINIPYGMTLKEIDDRFSDLKIIKKGDLIKYNGEFKDSSETDGLKKEFPYLKDEKSLEGYFFPDTYHFYQGSSIDFIAEKVISNFNDKVLPFLIGYDNFKDSLKIASLLEKEISDKDEQRIVAGILEKRLKAGMPLQIDATIVYIKCEGRFLNCGQLKKSDYKIDSP